jgi:hypothetical protein
VSTEATFEIGGLTRIDALRLRDREGVTIHESDIPAGTYGEPVTFTMVVTATALATLAAYLLRKHQGETFLEEVNITHPDGRKERRRVHWTKSATEAPESSIIKAISGSLPLGR